MNSTYLRNSVVRFNRCTLKSFFCEFGRENCNKNVAVFLLRSKNLKKNIAIFSSLIRPLTTTTDLQKILLQFNNLGRLRYQNETSNCFFFDAKKLLITFQFVLTKHAFSNQDCPNPKLKISCKSFLPNCT